MLLEGYHNGTLNDAEEQMLFAALYDYAEGNPAKIGFMLEPRNGPVLKPTNFLDPAWMKAANQQWWDGASMLEIFSSRPLNGHERYYYDALNTVNIANQHHWQSDIGAPALLVRAGFAAIAKYGPTALATNFAIGAGFQTAGDLYNDKSSVSSSIATGTANVVTTPLTNVVPVWWAKVLIMGASGAGVAAYNGDNVWVGATTGASMAFFGHHAGQITKKYTGTFASEALSKSAGNGAEITVNGLAAFLNLPFGKEEGE